MPPNQTEALVEALRRKRKPVGYLLFSGEQHGFRNAATIQRCLDAVLQFYAIEVFKIGLTYKNCKADNLLRGYPACAARGRA